MRGACSENLKKMCLPIQNAPFSDSFAILPLRFRPPSVKAVGASQRHHMAKFILPCLVRVTVEF